eukprot:CAMPEP_0181211572 /NCGR_PEP_ID=MMETSP1096-20121128/23863_1 /TAXON_ID=156174 ORGANISM="Chrysochromulina ericina, Strain CCMP281" /NCGR_SAMPLE_ID=MMETSP1096 /ASSEMBLY_ACC=CAM_ASM_000453 /LENGTH=143 /DNA_ID=CAMNT_0023302993 /DNA_START=431 /DNA_END=858 /DNA_ORIENTATION=+
MPYLGLPIKSCSLLLAHCQGNTVEWERSSLQQRGVHYVVGVTFGLQSANASARLFTSTLPIPFVIFVCSYTHFERHSSKLLSYFDALSAVAVAGSTTATAKPHMLRREKLLVLRCCSWSASVDITAARMKTNSRIDIVEICAG